MTTSLDKMDNKVQIHHRNVKRFHMVKRLKNRSSKSGDIRQNTLNHDVNTHTQTDKQAHNDSITVLA